MKKRQIILPEKKYEKAPSEDLSIRIDLNEEKNLLTNDDRDININLNELFNRERNESVKYKIFGKIRMVFRNMYKCSTVPSYEYLANRLALYGDGSDGDFTGYLPYNEYAFLRNDVYRQIINREGQVYNSLSEFDGFSLITTGSTDHTTITTINAPYYNWNFYLSYVYDKNTNYPMKYTIEGNVDVSFVSGDGIPFKVEDIGKTYKLTSPVPHGMSIGEYIVIKNPSNPTDLHMFYIGSVGDETYNSEKHIINISKTQVISHSQAFNGQIILGKRCLDSKNSGTTISEYYVHKHKIITPENGCTIDKIGFESSIWQDERKILFKNLSAQPNVIVERNRMETIIYDFNEPFLLTGITNNLGYTPTEVYVTTVFRNGNGYFNYPPKVGYDFNFHEYWIDNYFDGSSSNETAITGTIFTRQSNEENFVFTSGNTISTGTTLIGSFVEYNPVEMKERTISETYHKIIINPNLFYHGQTTGSTTFSGATETNPFGLFYQTHYRIKLRELSPQVEQSKETEIDNLPQNAQYFEDEKLWKWRDLYDHGYIDDDGNGTNYPFINNTHYVKTDINFYLRNEQLYAPKTDGINDFNNNGLIFC